jgi:hypothetical protein
VFMLGGLGREEQRWMVLATVKLWRRRMEVRREYVKCMVLSKKRLPIMI